MTRPTANLRLFAAVYPPPAAVQTLLQAARDLHTGGGRLTRADQVHLTLQFIGDTPSRELDAVIESVDRSCAGVGAFELTVPRLITLPERGPPRLIAAEAVNPSAALLELQRRLARRLATVPRKRVDDRFLPHFTLMRFSPGDRPDHTPERASAIEPVSFRIDCVRLMRSTLNPGGAEHHEVRAFGLLEG